MRKNLEILIFEFGLNIINDMFGKALGLGNRRKKNKYEKILEEIE